jgi:hypothetical protein
MQEISSILNSKLSPIMIFILVVLVVVLYYFHKPISAWVTSLIKRKEKIQDIKSLKSHDIFSTLQRVKQEAMFLKFFSHGKYDETKSRMSADFVRFKCDVCYDKFQSFLDNDFSKLSSDELKQLILSSLLNMHAKYVNEIKNHWIDRGIEKKDVDYVIELFELFRHGVVMGFQHRVEAIFSCEHYDSHFKKILASYNIFAFGIDLLPKDLQDTFESINGKFANIAYN